MQTIGKRDDVAAKPGTRTESEISRDVLKAIKLDLRIPSERIRASMEDGLVRLEGSVDWSYQKEAAERCARKVAGVHGVTNRIEVTPKLSGKEVKAKIEEALRRSADIDSRRIVVATQNGVVTLYGSVRSWFEKEQAERAAWAAEGVSRVVDHISVVRGWSGGDHFPRGH